MEVNILFGGLSSLLMFYIIVSVCESYIAKDGWFGKDIFLCHCELGCNSDGYCTVGDCATGWFGYKCQFQDLATIVGSTISDFQNRVQKKLIDRNNDTCIIYDWNNGIKVNWDKPYPFIWVRLKFKVNAILQNLEVKFYQERYLLGKVIVCLNKRVTYHPDNTVDISCEINVAIQRFEISNLPLNSAVCSLYINGGRNLALKQNTTQSTTFKDRNIEFSSDKAVDGNLLYSDTTSFCSHTDYGDTAPSWEITFPRSVIYRIDIYNRNTCCPERLSGFFLQMFNGLNQVFIYTDSSEIRQIYTVYLPCNLTATGVKISATYQDPMYHRKWLTLCEVEIFGACLSDPDEINCIDSCSTGCIDSTCNAGNGQCSCKPGYEGNTCDRECSAGKFGSYCLQNCSTYCNSPCNKTNGQCDCQHGHIGPTCNLECSDGQYGANCSRDCSRHCTSTICNKSNGSCVCQPGYSGTTCDKECQDKTYGYYCQNRCSSHCTSTCDKTNGFCSCEPGYYGSTCMDECHNGTYGSYCSHNCSVHCLSACDRTSGHCSNCKPGYWGLYCSEECPDGRYGYNCQDNCSSHCATKCNKTDGHCYCEPGYSGYTCHQACNAGLWGPNCSLHCSVQCYNLSCDGLNSSCTYGCIEGYHNVNCTDKCDKNHYGRNCLSNCSSSCVNETCNSINGYCYACYIGYQGNYCEKKCNSTRFGQDCKFHCNSSCLNGLCHPVTGQCLQCPKGKFGDQCDNCPLGKFGVDCLHDCSSNCKTRNKCQTVNGTCLDGCQDGYQGEMCNTTCDNNTYGEMCGSNCSLHCAATYSNETTPCHHVDGRCFHGCITGYQGSICIEAIKSSDDNPSVGAIVGTIVAVLVIAALIVIGVFYWKRRRSPKQKSSRTENQRLTNLKQTPSSPQNEKLADDSSKDEEEYVPDIIYYNTSSDLSVNMSMSVQDLNTFMLSHHKEFFTEQFQKIPQARDVSTEIALSDENKSKNRYKNISPYDHSRVNLLVNTGKKEGDYINASYIQDHHGKVKFIAAQGPNSAVINDFVRMLWEQNIEIVVMLTNLVEDGKVKCDKYWPESGKTSFGEIKVKLKHTQTYADYCIRRIELSKSNEEVRMFTHFHFTSWPDQGVPSAPWALIDFQQRVFAMSTVRHIVVHCSAGVGRTGTFIALHNVVSQAKETGKVDFYNTLVKLRRDRIFMVQTADQYEFLHKAAHAAIVCTGTFVTASDIADKVKELEAKEISGLTKMKKELQMVNTVCKVIRKSDDSVNKTDKGTKEKIYQNTPDLQKDNKNRFSAIVPRKFDRPYLACDIKLMGDYINAVFLPGFYRRNQYLLTQLPMPSTVTDFWRLVTQYKVSVIVAFEVERMATDQTIAMYLPTSEDISLCCDYFEVKSESIRQDQLWDEQALKVRSEKSKSQNQHVTHLKCKFTDLDATKLLILLKKIRSYNAQVDGKILYMCRNGATYSGICSVLVYLLDKLDSDCSVSVPLVVGAVKTIRPEVIPNMDQYRIVYDVLNRYCDSTSPYNNLHKTYTTKSQTTTKINNPTFDGTTDVSVNIYNNV